MGAISITVDLMFRLIVSIEMKICVINTSNCTLYIVNFFIGFDTLFVDSQNEAASLCINNSINKDAK